MRWALNGAERRVATLLSGPRLSRLARHSEDAARIAQVVRQLGAAPDPDSLAWIERIEAERQRLLGCERPLAPTPGDRDVPQDRGVSIGSVCSVSKSRAAATLLHRLVLARRPETCLELGTNLGISAAYQAAALAIVGSGRLITLETSSRRIEVARSLGRELGLSNIDFVTGSFDDRLEDVLARGRTVDFAFIDGNHRCEPTLVYFESIWRHAGEAAWIVFDDIRWSREMTDAWRRIQRDRRVRFAVDLWELGVCVTSRRPVGRAPYRSGLIPF